MEISNKMLAWLVVSAIVVSIFGTVISLNKLNQASSLTGFATSNVTGTASVAISSQTVLRFVVSSIDFGTGQINTSGGYYNCTMWINDSTTGTITKTGCVNFNSTIGSTFTLQNAGTTYLNVTLNFTANATQFIGGSTVPPSLQFMASNNGTGASCLNGLAYNNSWTEVQVANVTLYNICQNLSYYTNNTMMLGIKVVIPADAQGTKSLSIIAQGTG